MVPHEEPHEKGRFPGNTGDLDSTDLTDDSGASNNDTNIFRFDDAEGRCIYNLSTRGYDAPATYRIVVTLDDGTEHSVDFSLRP